MTSAAVCVVAEKNSSSSTNAGKQRPQRSLELSAGEKPAARVKSSARSTRGAPIGIPCSTSAAKIPISTTIAAGGGFKFKSQQTNDTLQADLSKKPSDAADINNLTAILGSVIERPKPRRDSSRRNHRPATPATSLSSVLGLTALPQRQFGAATTTIPSLSSALRYPLGTFTSPVAPSKQTSSQPSTRKESSASSITGSSTSSTNAASSWQSLREASAKEAETRLAAMSRDEILDSVQEVHALLDPSTLEFLKRRGQKYVATIHPSTNASLGNKVPSFSRPESHYPTSSLTHDNSVTEPSLVRDQDQQQKLQMAQVLSSIRTLDDLDAAHETLSSNATVGAMTNNVKHDDEWALACDLLRSTSSAQTLWACRVIARQLAAWQERCGNPQSAEFDRYRLRPVESTFVDHCSRRRANDKEDQDALERLTKNVSWPVALRCLLDVNAESLSSGTGAGMLHVTYILQSLCLLLQLRECRDHAVDVSSWMAVDETNHESASVYYQCDCFDDDIPTLPLSSYFAPEVSTSPSSASTMEDNPTTRNAAHQISDAAFMPISSTGAMADGEAFWRDPSWTLLSRMRIIPRLVQLLRQACRLQELSSEQDAASHTSDLANADSPPPGQWGYALSREAVIALCGILAMVCQRSPGAASAMAQHATLMDDLVTMTLLDKQGSVRLSDPSVSLVTIRLFGVLARQSRVAALALCQRMTRSSSFILQVLGHAVSTSDNAVRSRAHLAISQWTLILWRTCLRYGMGMDILPSVLTLTAPVLIQANADVSTSNVSFALIPELYSCFTAFLVSNHGWSQSSGDISSQLAQDCRLIFQGTWGESLQRLAIQRLDEMPDEESVLQCDTLRFMASHLRFLNASLIDEENVKSSNLNMHDESIYAQLITKLIKSKRMSKVLAVALRFAFYLHLEHAAEYATAKRLEACACTFLDAVLSFVLSLLHRNQLSTDGSLVVAIKALLISNLEPLLKTLSEQSEPRLVSNDTVFETSRCRWLNSAHALVACFLGIDTTSSALANGKDMSRAIALSVFGRLHCGDECAATILIRTIFPLEHTTSSNGQSLLTTILRKELGTSLPQQTQVTIGVSTYLAFWSLTDNDSSTLEVQSLVTNADSGRRNPTSFLPIGPFWLWKLLSVQSKGPEPAECTDVVLATANAIDEIDLCGNGSQYNVLCKLSVGPKLYYLTNLCLQMGAVQSPSLCKIVEALFDVYFGEMTTDDVVELAVECRKHSEPAPSDGPKQKKPLDELSEEDQMKAILGPLQTVDNGFAPATIKALETFADDLCSDFLDNSYAQSSFTAKCIRMLLVAGFPDKLRCLVVQRLLGAQHLLSLSDDDLSGLLPHFLTGGLPSIDGSQRDSPVLLDCIAHSYAAGTVLRYDDIFFSSWATAMLARSLGIGMALGFTSAMKNRMTLLDPLFATRVVQATQLWLSSNGSLNDLVAAASSDDLDTVEVSSEFARFIDRSAAVGTVGVYR
jgi:RPAP1-like, N-terminal